MIGYRPPVLIIGMHRSGTSLLAGKLHECGVFMGARRRYHEEACFFRRINQQLFRLAHADWDRPEPVRLLLECSELRAQVVASLQTEIQSFKVVSYLGLVRALKFRGLMRINHSWGWKDPRNTYTLPIWLDIFPEARVIHIYRNGVDVVYSLREREAARPNKLNNPWFSCRCLSLEGAFALWAEYEQMSLTVTRDLPQNRVLHLRYEDFVTAPASGLHQIAEFLEIRFKHDRIDRLVRDIHSESAYRFLNNDELQSFYVEKRTHPIMSRLGYDGGGAHGKSL